MKKALITGSAGLIGSESVRFLITKGYYVVGIDNDMRKYFFGDEASTLWNSNQLQQNYHDVYEHRAIDIRDNAAVQQIFQQHSFDIIIHTAAQPSHDWASKEPLTDFTINANGTLILLECYRQYAPQATFVFTSTNKVYGDLPNSLPLIEHEYRYEIDPHHTYVNGIDETMSIDQSKHSLFGASKVAADIMVQEYGNYFGLKTGVFRGGCLTGPMHSGAQLHGFLSYLAKCIITGKEYTIFGYRGKQVRDNIHAFDLVNMFWHFHMNPKPGSVYNAGGGRHSNISVYEAIQKIENITGKKARYAYSKEHRTGDHIWYISDVSKFKHDYSSWDYTYTIDSIIQEICDSKIYS